MTLGLGIFLSSLFLGTIFLFHSTKDRWNWKKILIIWPLRIVVVAGVIGGAGFYIYDLYENKPKKYDDYLGIPLNASEEDIIFFKGNKHNRKFYDIDKKNVAIYYDLNKDDDYTNNFKLREGKVWRISCSSNRSYDCTSINKVGIKDTIRYIEERLGKPDHITSSDDDTKRMWAYENFNIYMIIEKGIVETIGIFYPELGIPSYNDDVVHDFIDFNNIDLKGKMLTIKGYPIIEEANSSYKNNNLINEIINNSSEGDEIIWSEYIQLKEKQAEAIKSANDRLAAEKAKAKAQRKELEELRNLQAKAQKKENEKAKWETVGVVKPETNENSKWSKIKKGMAEYQIVKILGEPIKKEGQYWYYSEDRRDGAHLYFTYNSSAGVREVYSFKVP